MSNSACRYWSSGAEFSLAPLPQRFLCAANKPRRHLSAAVRQGRVTGVEFRECPPRRSLVQTEHELRYDPDWIPLKQALYGENGFFPALRRRDVFNLVSPIELTSSYTGLRHWFLTPEHMKVLERAAAT